MNAGHARPLFPPTRRTLATGLLVAMAAVFLLTFAFDERSFWTRLVRAAAEASLVGGIADWFAVTALFRRPLGLPIPHTAIVPMNKDRIGQGLANFLGKNFLSAESLAVAIRSAEPARRLGDWLSVEANARRATDHFFETAPMRETGVLAAKMLRPALRKSDLRPLLDIATNALSETGLDAALLDDVLQTAQSFLHRKAGHLNESAARRRQGLLRRSFDRQVMRAILEGLERLLRELSDKNNASRRVLIDTAQARIRTALLSRENANRLQDWVARMIESPNFEVWLASLFDARAHGRKGADEERRAAVAGVLAALGERLRADAKTQQELDAVLASVGMELLPLQNALVERIAEVVGSYESKAFAELIERAVDNDLQFIRINGTVIGAVVGCLLFLVKTGIESPF
jgi:uncharacterized membrane-anchored protein YjiN (DUF445 family)